MNTKQFLLLFLVVPFLSFGQWTQIGSDIDGEAAGDWSGLAIGLSSDGNILAVGAGKNDGNGLDSGHVRVYENVGGVWTQIGSDIEGEASGDQSGSYLSLSDDGNIVAIGAYWNDGNGSNSGHVRVYENMAGIWTQIGSDIDGEAASDGSGRSVSLNNNGSIVAIGAVNNDDNGTSSGHVRVYEDIGGVWTQIGSDIDGEAANDNSGIASELSDDGNILAIGAWRNDGNGSDSGHVRIFENVGGAWTQIGSDIDGEEAGDQSGLTLSLSGSGNFIAIGARLNGGNGLDSGHVRVYENVGDAWVQIGSDIDGEAAYDASGVSTSLNYEGNVLAIGAPFNDASGTDSGHVRVYKNEGGVWNQVSSDIDAEAVNDRFGTSVRLSADGSTLAVGAFVNDENGVDSGHVRVYQNTLLSVEENTFSSKFILYPNPTTNTIHIKANNTIAYVKVYSLLGKQILSTTPNTLTEEINMSGFNSGMYLVKVKLGEQTATYKVVKE